MTRLFINLFFIVILCFTLAVMPINIEILDLFDFTSMFSSEPDDASIVTEPVDDAFVATFNVQYSLDDSRLYNPTTETITVKSNIPEIYEKNFDYNDLEMTLYKNDDVFQIFKSESFVKETQLSYENELLVITYTIDLSYDGLKLIDDGFFDAEFKFTALEKSAVKASTFKLAYRQEIDYVSNGSVENNGNFIYKAFFLNESETALVPLYFSVKYPNSITVEARDRLYNPPKAGAGLSLKQVLPNKTSISKIANKHYGVYFKTDQFSDIIKNKEDAELSISAIVQTLTRLPHIDKVSIFVDNQQAEGALYDIDLKTIYEESTDSYVYLTEKTTSDKRYLLPVMVYEENIYDEVWLILNLLKSGKVDEKTYTQIIPPEVEFSNFIIEGTTLTLDVNQAFLEVYKDYPEYEQLMFNSLIYSLTSSPNITKIAITVEGEPLNSFAGFDLSEPLLAPPYINYIGEY